MVQMQREIDILRATEEMFRRKILDLELDNDDLERTERYLSIFLFPFFFSFFFFLTSLCAFRAAASSLSDLEVKLNKAIERNVILGKHVIQCCVF